MKLAPVPASDPRTGAIAGLHAGHRLGRRYDQVGVARLGDADLAQRGLSARGYLFLLTAFFPAVFRLCCLAFLWDLLTIGDLGLSRVAPELASAGQPFGRARSNGPEIAWVTTPFSR